MNVCVIGRGKVGRSLERALRDTELAPTLLPGRRFRVPPAARVFLLAVPDSAIRATAARLAGAPVHPRAVVLHTAGARGLDELDALAGAGVGLGVFHPLVSFASARRPQPLAGVTFTCFGDRRAVACARRIAAHLTARCVVVKAPPGPAYHAAAALVANGAAALAHAGVQLLIELGFAPRAAERALGALLASVAHNVTTLGVPDALTGPVARGDVATVKRHLEAVRRLDPAIAEAYAALQPTIVACARAAGLAPRKGRAILRASAAHR